MRFSLFVIVIIVFACGMISSAADWPMTRGGLARTGVAPGTAEPLRPILNWRWRNGEESFFSSPAIADGKVYVTSGTIGALAESGAIYCFDAASGKMLWKCSPPGYRATFSSPVISGKYLVVGEGLHVCRDARLVCLDISGEQPKILWTYRANSHIECTPVIDNGRVYVGAGDDGYYCLNLQPDAAGQAVLNWHAPGDKYKDAETSLTVAGGKVYAGLGIGGRELCVLDAITGEEQKRIPLPYPVFSPATIVDGKLYLGMGNGDYINATPGGEVRCIDIATMATDWTYPLAQTVLGAVVSMGDKLYFGSRDGWLYNLDKTGILLGKYDTHGPIVTSPAVSEHFIYVMSDTGFLTAINRTDLTFGWEFMVGSKPLFISSPSVGNGQVFIGSQQDGLLAIGASDKPAIAAWNGYLGQAGRAGNLDDSPLADAGAFQWNYPAEMMGENTTKLVVAPVAVAGKNIIIPMTGKQSGVVCLPADASAQETPKIRWSYATTNPVSLSPAIIGENVFVIDGIPDMAARTLTCLNVADGKMRWELPVADGTGVFSATENEIFMQDIAGKVSCIELDGKPRWAINAGVVLDGFSVIGDTVYFATANGLVAVNRLTGKDGIKVPVTALAAPVFADGVIYLATNKGIESRDAKTGELSPNGQLPGGAATGAFAVTRNEIVYINGAGELVIIERNSGKVINSIAKALPIPPLVSRNMVLYLAKDGIMRLDLARPAVKPTQWLDTSWLGEAATPMVLSRGNVYLGIAGWGLVRAGRGQ